MENRYSEITSNNSFSFLSHSSVQKHFANLNIALLRGTHIDESDHYLFTLLEEYFNELKEYYFDLYKLKLDKKTFENKDYYFLNFFIDSKGVLSSNSRHKQLSPIQTITAITLLNMYYEKQFEKYKIVSFSDIREKIEQSEFGSLYRKAFFKNATRKTFSAKEWSTVRTNIKNVIIDFEQLGWVENVNNLNENDFSFVLKHSIHRFQLLYEYEIANLNEFIKNLKAEENE
ncbi:conserved hypothetical protein [Tenacibaculum maritimum]|uniref:condensin complex protein MksE n=1 Tax=Tenacibaculum maritimum TaxID=107401 RepID=UPI0012E55E7F|nr:hypothetical protein [Tenacibaculum maritimum]CAA0170044.1 conserved hypothetical protein [Tenacibaculum maritimum]